MLNKTRLTSIWIFLENCNVLHYAQDFPINNKNDKNDLTAGIVTIVNLATDLFIPKVKFKSYIPYWNTMLSSLHKDMKLKQNNWIRAGKPRTEESKSFKEYKSLKTKLRCAHRDATTSFLREQEADRYGHRVR
jgi:hypothetical protein